MALAKNNHKGPNRREVASTKAAAYSYSQNFMR